jgi:hypothetical protein
MTDYESAVEIRGAVAQVAERLTATLEHRS